MKTSKSQAGMPELETARLHLRSFTLDDLSSHYQIIGSDPQVTFSGEPLTLEQSWSALEKRIRHWDEHGFGMWAVVQKDSGALLGNAGLPNCSKILVKWS